MMNFDFQNPTRIVFGAGTLSRLGEVTHPYGQRALLVTGGGSIKRSGAFDKAVASLKNAGVAVVEFAGVEPNPRLTTVLRGRDLAKTESCDVVVALGGGSVMDAAKVMAAAVLYEKDPWEMMIHSPVGVRLPTRALPVITVPTLAATGSEMNMGAVITNEETIEKSYVQADCLYPRVALVDPELTLSVPQDQTAFGVCDLITHVTEGYFNGIDGVPIQDRFAEGVILTALEWGPRAVFDGNDLEARTQVQWASVVALNGWVQAGANAVGFPVHMIEHTISAIHDVAHGAGLAVVNPAWMRAAATERPARFAQFAERIFGVAESEGSELERAQEGVNRFESFLRSIKCPTRLSELNLDGSLIERYAQETLQTIHDDHGQLPGRPAMDEATIIKMLKGAVAP